MQQQQGYWQMYLFKIDPADSLGVCICHDWPAMDYGPRLQGWSLWQGMKYSMCCLNGEHW